VTEGIPESARAILDAGVLCHVAAPSPPGPHLTPAVYVLDGDRLWGTTSRRSTKAARWRREPLAGGLVRAGHSAVTFRGAVTLYDALDPSTWSLSLARAAQVARASARFTVKNARFFAGYGRDAARVPLGWTPPARIIFSVDLEAGVVLDERGIADRWGGWGGRLETRPTYRRAPPGLATSRLPIEVRDLVVRSGWGTVATAGRRGPSVLPVRWTRWRGSFHAVVSRRILAMADAPAEGPASLVVDRASAWRAARMRGILFRGDASVFDLGSVRAGGGTLAAALGDLHDAPEDPAVLRIRPRTAVWWSGWSSGTVGRR
jgi:hypothetical protein